MERHQISLTRSKEYKITNYIMKRDINMKKLSIFTVIIFTVLTFTQSQNIKYSYDASGNRIKREIIIARSNSLIQDNQNDPIEELLSEKTIRIYPNPTKGNLAVEIEEYDYSTKGYINIYNLKGQLILKMDILNRTTEIDISSQASGTYIMNLDVDGQKSTWKIIKE